MLCAVDIYLIPREFVWTGYLNQTYMLYDIILHERYMSDIEKNQCLPIPSSPPDFQ